MGIFNRLLGREKSNQVSHQLNIEEAQRIVQDYGDFLAISSPPPGAVADVNKLPHDKPVIKEALATCISVIRDPELAEHLKHGYLMLSAWQIGVGDKNRGLDFTRINLDMDPLELAELIQRKSDTMDDWRPLIKTEQATLTAELNALVA